MPRPRLRPLALATAALSLAALPACRRERGPVAPSAEFLVATGDSTFWVTSAGGRIRVRGAPLQLAYVDGRFVELYIVDEDRSYYDAVLVGQRIYRRDLLTNDSVLVFRDTVVAAVAERYAELHPDEQPLAPDEETAERPGTIATVEVELLPAYGAQLSYEYHADLDAAFAEELHETRRGVLDLGSGDPRTLADLFGGDAGRALADEGRRQFDAMLDSVLAARREEATRAARAIDDFVFDPTSFSLLDSARTPQVVFVAPGRGDAGGGLILPVAPVAAPVVPWWTAIADRLPLPPAAGEGGAAPDGTVPVARWPRPAYELLARYDDATERVALALRDTLAREWRAARVPAPVEQIFWLDAPAIDSTTRRALEAAFDEAALYSEDVRSVSFPSRRAPALRIARAAAARRPAGRERRPAPPVATLRTRATS